MGMGVAQQSVGVEYGDRGRAFVVLGVNEGSRAPRSVIGRRDGIRSCCVGYGTGVTVRPHDASSSAGVDVFKPVQDGPMDRAVPVSGPRPWLPSEAIARPNRLSVSSKEHRARGAPVTPCVGGGAVFRADSVRHEAGEGQAICSLTVAGVGGGGDATSEVNITAPAF